MSFHFTRSHSFYRRFQQKRVTQKNQKTQTIAFWGRRQSMLGIFGLIISLLLWRAIDLQINNTVFFQNQGNARHVRTLKISAHRGMLMDRYGEPLAISTPVESVWVNPSEFVTVSQDWSKLTQLLEINLKSLKDLLAKRMDREFVYVKRHISPALARQVRALQLPGVFLQREYHRYYPLGEVSAHILGFTNIDDLGQEGLELALNQFLMGVAGEKRVIQDKHGQIIAYVENLSLPRPGQNIRLSLDRRLQYLAYRELKAAVLQAEARAGSAIILDIHTGEVLAMVNQPAYNPNNRRELQGERYRNRAVTDLFEPGSTLKPFTIAAALESGKYAPTTLVNTNPGYLRLKKYTVRDSRNYGLINLATVIKKSSNVGASKIALSLKRQQLWQVLNRAGLGQISNSGFPGESAGLLTPFRQWPRAQHASISFGYGISVTLLQLARAYAVLGNGGILPPIYFLPLKNDEHEQVGESVIQARTARQILNMLEAVVKSGGTGTLAQIKGYRVAGKTGTVRKIINGEYSKTNYLALFAGIVPTSKPRLVMVVLIDEPRQGSYYGGKVAAPIFAKVMSGALRLLNIPPDNIR
jgi:cell division protein FtsI (penicillin-binding protein 3)